MADSSITGLDALRNQLSKLPLQMQTEIKQEIQASALTIVRNAQAKAPVDQGRLRSLISVNNISDLEVEVVSGADYSAYLEFGTGKRVSIPAGLEAVAAQAKGTGRVGSLSAKDAIYAWCARVGIDKKLWWTIFISIMTNGIKAHPFFFSSYYAEKPNLINRIKKILS